MLAIMALKYEKYKHVNLNLNSNQYKEEFFSQLEKYEK